MEALRELVWQLRAQRSRAVLTVLSVTWGTLSVVLLLAFGAGFHDHFLARARGIGPGVVVAWPARTTLPHAGFGAGRPVRLTRDDVRLLPREIPEMAAVSSEFAVWRPVTRGERVQRVRLAGVDPEFLVLRNMQPRAGGRFLNAADLGERRRVVFLGDRIAATLFDGDPVGRALILAQTPFTVVGVLEPKDQDSDYGGLDADLVCLPATTHVDLFGDRHLSNFVFRARAGVPTGHVVRRMYEVLGARHGFAADDVDAVPTWDLTEQQDMIAAIFVAMNVMFGVSGGFTLIVGGIGVANLMFLLVRRRTREIGLQLAIGARPRRVLLEVLSQSAALVAAGGLLGFAISGYVLAAVRRLDVEQQIGVPHVPASLALLTVALLGAVALLAGWAPARRAARLDPVVALAT